MCKISAVQKGRHAFHMGKDKEANPYDVRDNDHALWNTGWETASEMYEQEKKKFRL